ncbi:uncharacterized protein KIAA1841 homolog [Protopterus annectens]|uniref:uncharacterized protein KIAA1841 homolog n=1 Tax=Protopterus annectens TaxID=7888 RepID=UPI001CF9A294|nr:uncharacterized protein KIAA1841 homolog [Protopterus annectens]
MNHVCSENNNFPYGNNQMVLDIILYSLLEVRQPIDWDSVSRLVPGFSPKECSRRYEELKNNGVLSPVDNQCTPVMVNKGSPTQTLASYIKATLLTQEESTDQSITHCGISVTGRAGTSSGRKISSDAEKCSDKNEESVDETQG